MSAARASKRTAPAPARPAVAAVLSSYDLCVSLRNAGLALALVDHTTLLARPRAAVSEPIALAITHHKPALLNLLATLGGGPITPSTCAFCTARFVRSVGDWCPECEPLRGTEFKFAPGSADETAFLRALEARKVSQKTVPNSPSDEKRQELGQFTTTVPAL